MAQSLELTEKNRNLKLKNSNLKERNQELMERIDELKGEFDNFMEKQRIFFEVFIEAVPMTPELKARIESTFDERLEKKEQEKAEP